MGLSVIIFHRRLISGHKVVSLQSNQFHTRLMHPWAYCLASFLLNFETYCTVQFSDVVLAKSASDKRAFFCSPHIVSESFVAVCKYLFLRSKLRNVSEVFLVGS